MMRAGFFSLAILSCTACGLFHNGRSEEALDAGGPHDDAEPAAPAADSGEAVGDKLPEIDAGAGAGVAQEQVWIGELWTATSDIFCEPGRDWTSRRPSLVEAGVRARVVLKLDLRDPNELSGEIQFGESGPVIPLRPDSDPTKTNGSVGSFWDCSHQRPVPGVAYRILAGSSTEAALEFEFALNQIWDEWCRRDEPVCPNDGLAICDTIPTCVCADGRCHADLHVRSSIRLSRTADTIEGHVPWLANGWATPVDIRLRRLR